MKSIIIADLHLNNDYALFQEFCQSIAPHYDNLFILGDLFNLYLGDDLIDTYYQKAVGALSTLSQTTHIFIMVGNRDFLIGKTFAQQSGATLITEPYIFENYVLMHGDELVRGDRSYQLFKKIMQNRVSKFLLNALPKTLRIALARKIQAQTKQTKQQKTLEIMDVDNGWTDIFMQNYRGKDLIHGHTHRPFVHHRKHYTRYVLPSWEGEVGAIVIEDRTISYLK